MNKPKLSPTQEKVMLWLSQGWEARLSAGSCVEINATRFCNVSTMKSLERLGLVEQESKTSYWTATAEGRKLNPRYQADEPQGILNEA
ncbi:hypothetical protein ACI2KR_08270 [Pseudomonas luteola]